MAVLAGSAIATVTLIGGHSMYLTVTDVAQRLGISVSSVWRLIRSRELESIKIGRVVRISAAALDALVAARTRAR